MIRERKRVDPIRICRTLGTMPNLFWDQLNKLIKLAGKNFFKKCNLKLIQNTGEFISEHEVVFKIPGSIW